MVAARRCRDDSGAVLVESAFVLPVFVVLFFTVIEFGLLMAAQSTAVSATREGARFGSANFAVAASQDVAVDEIRKVVESDLKVDSDLDTPEVLWVYEAAPEGHPIGDAGFTSCTTSCYRYIWHGSGFLLDTLSPGWTGADLCIPDLDSIGVYVRGRHSYVTGILGAEVTIEEHTVLRLEPLPLSQCATP